MSTQTRVIVYARTSGDEGKSEQDIETQRLQVLAECQERGYAVMGCYVDEGVSGSVRPVERPGFQAAYNEMMKGTAEAIICRDITRYERRHPFMAGHDYMSLLSKGGRILFSHDQQLPVHAHPDDWSLGEIIILTVAFGEGQSYRVVTRRNTQLAMDAIKAGTKATRSGLPPGRPRKVSTEEVHQFYDVAVEEGIVEAANRLSLQKGWNPMGDHRNQKKHRVRHSTLIEAFKRENLIWPPSKTAQRQKMILTTGEAEAAEKRPDSGEVQP